MKGRERHMPAGICEVVRENHGNKFAGGHATIQPKWLNFEKSRWTVRQQWLVVTRPSADCQTTFFWRFKQFGKIFKKVTERSRDSGRRSRDRWMTVKQRFLTFQAIRKIFEKIRWTVTATVVGGHATVGRLSNNVFSTFQAIRRNFEKSRWTVTRQWSEVTRLSADCQTTFFRRFKQFGNFSKKVAERSRGRGGGVKATVGRLSNNVFSTVQPFRRNFEKSRWTVTRQWSEVTRLSADCQTTFFGRFKQFEIFLRKVTERSRDSGRRSRDRRPTVKQRFFGRFKQFEIFFEKCPWTVTRQWSEVTRPSADCQTTFFGRFKQFEIFLKKVTERSRDSGRRSRDRRLTVKHIYAWIRERERERVGERDYLSYICIRAPPCCAVGRFISRRPGWG